MRRRDVLLGDAGRVQLDVEADEISAFARDDQDVAVLGGVDRGLDPDVREVRDGEDVHHAPGLVRRVADELAADRGADGAARAVAADHVAGPDRGGLAGPGPRLHVLERHRHGVLAVGHVHRAGLQAVEGPQPGGRALHVLGEIGEHPGLVDDHVRHLRQAVLDVVDPPGPLDPRAVLGVRSPEADLVDPVGLVHQALGEAEGLEHLHGAAGDAVGLPDFERTVATVDDRRRDAGEPRQLGGEDQAGRAAPDDQHVDGRGQRLLLLRDRRMPRLDQRVAGSVAVEVELHPPGRTVPCHALSAIRVGGRARWERSER